ncbi:hypothetical protein OAO18_04485 [Francisellaceae bacterium]|nr:hypothetical protein [Francisellaceae bacterium]
MNKSMSKAFALSLIGIISWLSISILVGHYKVGKQMSLYQDPQASHYIEVDVIH